MQNELFIVEYEDGEVVDVNGEGGFSVFYTRAEAQDALDSESSYIEDKVEAGNLRVARFPREAKPSYEELMQAIKTAPHGIKCDSRSEFHSFVQRGQHFLDTGTCSVCGNKSDHTRHAQFEVGKPPCNCWKVRY